MQKNINHKIREALDSLDGMDKASVKPFFFTRLEARMQKERNSWEMISSFVSRPVIAFACIFAVIVINAAVIFSSERHNTGASKQNDEIATLDEYSLVSSNFYEIVNTQP